jgi:hypothetical protein
LHPVAASDYRLGRVLFIEDAFPLIVTVNARRFDEIEARSMADGYQRYFTRNQRYAVLSVSPRDAEPVGAKARKAVAEWVGGPDVQQYARALCVGAASVVEGAIARGALTALLWLWTPPMPLRPCATLDEGLDYCFDRLAAEGVSLPRPQDEIRRETMERLRKLL